MDIDVAPHGVDRTPAIKSGLAPREPQDSCEYPVALRILRRKIFIVNFPRRAAADKHRIRGLPGTDLGADHMQAARGAIAAHALADPKAIAAIEKAAIYQLIHALVLIMSTLLTGTLVQWSRAFFLIGIFLFCGFSN